MEIRSSSSHGCDRPKAAAANAVMAASMYLGSLMWSLTMQGLATFRPSRHASIEFRAQIETNLFWNDYCDEAALRYFAKESKASSIQFSSVAGRMALRDVAYSAAKWGVEGFSEAFRAKWHRSASRFHNVEPGGFSTDFAGSSTELSEVVLNTIRRCKSYRKISAEL